MAIHGIRLPGGFTEWNPMTGEANRIKLIPGYHGGIQVDARGDTCPIPAASRLFVGRKEAKKVLVPIARAALRYGSELAFQDNDQSEWRDWFNEFLDSLRGFSFGTNILIEELELLDSIATYLIHTDKGEVRALNRQEIVSAYGRWLPARYGHSGEGARLSLTDRTTAALLTLRPKRKREEGIWEVDLEGTVSVKGDSLEEAGHAWRED